MDGADDVLDIEQRPHLLGPLGRDLLGLDAEGYSEVLAVIGLYNQMNKLCDALQIEPDILPKEW